MDEFEKQCQSCGMPLKKGANSGTEVNGELSREYCLYCYSNGQFINPEMTLSDMKKVIDEKVGTQGLQNKLMAWLGKMQLPSLKRWKQ